MTQLGPKGRNSIINFPNIEAFKCSREQAKMRMRNRLSVIINSSGGNNEMPEETWDILAGVINDVIHASRNTINNKSVSGSTISF